MVGAVPLSDTPHTVGLRGLRWSLMPNALANRQQTRATEASAWADFDTVAHVAAGEPISRGRATEREGIRYRPREPPSRRFGTPAGPASRHAPGIAPTYATTHPACAIGHEGNGPIREARIRQSDREHQGPHRLLDPETGGRAR